MFDDTDQVSMVVDLKNNPRDNLLKCEPALIYLVAPHVLYRCCTINVGSNLLRGYRASTGCNVIAIAQVPFELHVQQIRRQRFREYAAMRQAAVRIARWKVSEETERIQDGLQARERTDIADDYPPPSPHSILQYLESFFGLTNDRQAQRAYPHVVRRRFDHTLRQGGNVGFDQFDVRPTIVRNPSASLL